MNHTKRKSVRVNHTKNFLSKPKTVQDLIVDAICILQALGISKAGSMRQNEKTAMVFLALADMTAGKAWERSSNISNHNLTTRGIIKSINDNYNDVISSGSYDDIRRRGITALMAAGIVEQSMPWAAQNDSRRGYGISLEASQCIRHYNTPKWTNAVDKMLKAKHKHPLAKKTTLTRNTVHVNNRLFKMSPGTHNQIQKSVIEVMLPLICKNAKILYFGDSNKKELVYEKTELHGMGIKVSIRGMLPDIIAYSAQKNSIYIIEAVHTSNPISGTRRNEFAKMCKNCKADITYISAFKNKKTLQKFVSSIGWKTKVWLVDSPDHLIHFNGE